jgi:carbonic anhydrase
MDARLDPAKFAGLVEGDAHVIRNAGGRASDDAIRSLVISHKLLGTQEYVVVHHTDCGMEYFDQVSRFSGVWMESKELTRFDQGVMSSLLAKDLESANIAVKDGAVVFEPVGKAGTGSVEGSFVNWMSFKGIEQSVRDDVERIKNHPLVDKAVPVSGYVYDVGYLAGRLKDGILMRLSE